MWEGAWLIRHTVTGSHTADGRLDEVEALPPCEDDGSGGVLENTFPGEFSSASDTRMTLLVPRSSSSASITTDRAGAWRGGVAIMTVAPLELAAAAVVASG